MPIKTGPLTKKMLYQSKLKALKAFQNLKMSAKLSGAQNGLSASAAKIFERTKALDLLVTENCFNSDNLRHSHPFKAI